MKEVTRESKVVNFDLSKDDAMDSTVAAFEVLSHDLRKLLMERANRFWQNDHVKQVSDLLFEVKHQVLERGVHRDRHANNTEWEIYTD